MSSFDEQKYVEAIRIVAEQLILMGKEDYDDKDDKEEMDSMISYYAVDSLKDIKTEIKGQMNK